MRTIPNLREDQWAITVVVAGVNLDTLPWATMSGGDIEAKSVHTRAGGMGEDEPLGAPRLRTDATVGRQYTNDVLHPLLPALERVAGNAAMSISWVPLDGNKNPNGNTFTISGKLDAVMQPKKDANATAATFLELVMSCNSDPVVVS